jgi:hypothetical protein
VSAAELLLHNILPRGIAQRLKTDSQLIADKCTCSVLFADIVGFTPLSASMDAQSLVEILNDIFGMWDRSCVELGACTSVLAHIHCVLLCSLSLSLSLSLSERVCCVCVCVCFHCMRLSDRARKDQDYRRLL